MINRTIASIFVGVVLSSGLGVLAASQDETPSSTAAAQQPGELLTRDEILQRVKAQHPGTIVETELERKHGRYVYEIEVVDDNGVKTELKYDAKTGDLISSEVEREDGDEDKDD